MPTAARLVVFTNCDTLQLDAAVSLVRSVDLFSPGNVFALHIVNPSRNELERLRCLAETLVATRLAVSVEHLELSGLTVRQRHAYQMCGRYFRLAEVLHELPCPVLALDPESLVLAPLDPAAEESTPPEIKLVRSGQQTASAEWPAPGNGTLWLRPTPGAQLWLEAVCRDLVDAFARGVAEPHTTQMAVNRQVQAFESIVSIDNRLALHDAPGQPGADTVVWSTQGRPEQPDMRFAILQRMLIDDPRRQSLAVRMADEMVTAGVWESSGMQGKLGAARAHIPARVALFVPRLDQPWAAASSARRAPPPVSAETLGLRLHWKDFTARLANAVERRGIPVEIIEWPLREIVPENVDAMGAQLALIPHRCKLDYAAGRTPVLFYMQEYFRWVFVVDADGWSAASSRYPVDPKSVAMAPTGPFDTYRRRLAEGELSSKFGQPSSSSRAELQALGQTPAGPFVFMPLQIPHDQSIRYFSSVSESEVVAALVRWCEQRQVPLVLKPHPANAKSMAEFAALPRGNLLYWSTANVQDLIAHSAAVYTINSGVGFEALLQLKPVVTFGRAEYDCVSIHASIDTLDETWQQVQKYRTDDLAQRYGAFVDWFLGCYAVDMSLEVPAKQRLEQLADDIVARVGGNRTALRGELA